MRLLNARILLAAAVVLIFSSCSGRQELVTDRVALSIGETSIDLLVHRSSNPGLSYLNLHDNENTAVEAALYVLRLHGGTLFELTHTSERNVTFQLGDSTFEVDPNRIFTAPGIDSTLSKHGAATPPSHDAVRSFAGGLLQRLDFDASALVVTVHNNSEGAYSILSYADGGDLASDARFVHVEAASDPDDFYFVTSELLYDELRRRGSNVVMQDNDRVKDDGSLAVLAAREGIPYVNVEAQHGHFEEQRQMIARLHQIVVEAEEK